MWWESGVGVGMLFFFFFRFGKSLFFSTFKKINKNHEVDFGRLAEVRK